MHALKNSPLTQQRIKHAHFIFLSLHSEGLTFCHLLLGPGSRRPVKIVDFRVFRKRQPQVLRAQSIMVASGSLTTRVRVTYLLHTCPDSLHFFQSKVVYLLRRHVTRDVEPEDLRTTGNKVNFRNDVAAGSQSPPSLFACLFVWLFVCLFVCWFCLPDPALSQEITVVASSFLLSGSLHLLVCLFVCWLVYQLSVQMT